MLEVIRKDSVSVRSTGKLVAGAMLTAAALRFREREAL